MLRRTKPPLPREVEAGQRVHPRNQPKQSLSLLHQEVPDEDVEGRRRKTPRKKNPKTKRTIKKKKRRRSKTIKSILTTTNDLLKSLATQSNHQTTRAKLNVKIYTTQTAVEHPSHLPLPTSCCHISTSFRSLLFKLFIFST